MSDAGLYIPCRCPQCLTGIVSAPGVGDLVELNNTVRRRVGRVVSIEKTLAEVSWGNGAATKVPVGNLTKVRR